MERASKSSSKEIQDKFFVQLLALNKQLGKATAGQCKVSIWQSKMVPFLALKYICMANQYKSN